MTALATLHELPQRFEPGPVPHRLDLQRSEASLHGFVCLRLLPQPAQALTSRSASWACGHGLLSFITSNCAVWRDRGVRDDGLSRTFSVVLQLEGALSYLGQAGRRCRLVAGALCFIDGDLSFQIEPSGAAYTHLVLSLPRAMVLQRFPALARCTARSLDDADPGVGLYRQALVEAQTQIRALHAEQRAALSLALLHLLGVIRAHPLNEAEPGIEPALRFIEDRLHHPHLGAQNVAQALGLSRRSLDQRFVRACGHPVAAHIQHRRMAEAAAALADPRQRHRTVWEIGSAIGYADASHFARAFKRHHGVTASAWRERALS